MAGIEYLCGKNLTIMIIEKQFHRLLLFSFIGEDW